MKYSYMNRLDPSEVANESLTNPTPGLVEQLLACEGNITTTSIISNPLTWEKT